MQINKKIYIQMYVYISKCINNEKVLKYEEGTDICRDGIWHRKK